MGIRKSILLAPLRGAECWGLRAVGVGRGSMGTGQRSESTSNLLVPSVREAMVVRIE